MKPAALMGSVRVPGDKSIGHRAWMLAALGDGQSRVEGIGAGADLHSTRAALEALGVSINADGGGYRVAGVGLRGLRPGTGALDCGNSGTTIRLLLGLLAGQRGRFVLDGDASLRRRPMRRVTDVVARLGGRFALPAGDRPPVEVRGGSLVGATVDTGLASAQVKSAALLAGLLAEGPSTVIERGPSRDHTERMLQDAGVELRRVGLAATIVPPARLPARRWRVPGDISSAAFWLAAAALLPGSDLTVAHVGLNPTRTGFVDVLRAMGVDVQTRITEEAAEPIGEIRVRGGALRGARIGGTVALRALDELPLVAVLGALAEGETVVSDAAELRLKESDRVAAMADGLRAMGAAIDATPDGWQIDGRPRLRGAAVEVRHDHRVAMALRVAGLRAEGPVRLDDPAVAGVSYPGFFAALEARLANKETR